MHYTLKEQVEILKESVSDLTAIKDKLKDDLFYSNRDNNTLRDQLNIVTDKYNMIMSKVRPLVKEVAKLDR